jgi:hypothetical protein
VLLGLGALATLWAYRQIGAIEQAGKGGRP